MLTFQSFLWSRNEVQLVIPLIFLHCKQSNPEGKQLSVMLVRAEFDPRYTAYEAEGDVARSIHERAKEYFKIPD